MKIENIASDIIVFSVRGEPNLGDELQAIAKMIAGDINSHIIIDFAGVDIIRSSSLTLLLKLRQALIARGLQTVLCGLHNLTQSILEITDLNTIFTVVSDRQAGEFFIHNGQFARVP